MINRRQIAFAACLTVLIEFGLLVMLAWWLTSRPADAAVVQDPPPETPPEEEVVLIQPAPELAELLTFVRTRADQAADAPSAPTPFIGAETTRAASEEPAVGEEPVPTSDGIEAPGLTLEDQDFRDGPDVEGQGGGTPGQPGLAAAAPATSATPTDGSEGEAEEEARVAAARPVPDLVELPEELPRMQVRTPEEKLRTPREADDPGEEEQQLAARPPAAVGGGGKPGFQEERVRRALEGTINQEGVASLDVEETPLGRYMQIVSKVIARDWQRAFRRNENLLLVQPGFIRVHFVVSSEGRVISARAVDVRDASESQKWSTIRAVLGARLPPIPPEVRGVLDDGQLEVNFNFLFFM